MLSSNFTINGHLSQARPITSSIPQGGCLSPLLFIVFTSSLLNQLTQTGLHVHSFADDVKITSSCPRLMQGGFNIVSKWCSDWQMELSVSKCMILPIGTGLGASYQLNGESLRINADPQRDLGFIVSPSLSLSPHVSKICAKATQMASMILRCFSSPSPSLLTRAYCVYVRPLLESGTPVFNSMKKRDSDNIERVQRWFSRLIFRRCHINNRRLGYEYRLKYLKLESLCKRRVISDLTFLHAVYHGRQYCPDLIVRKTNVRQLLHNHRLVSDVKAKGRLRFQWPQRVISVWNSIPEKIILSSHSTFLKYLKSC